MGENTRPPRHPRFPGFETHLILDENDTLNLPEGTLTHTTCHKRI